MIISDTSDKRRWFIFFTISIHWLVLPWCLTPDPISSYLSSYFNICWLSGSRIQRSLCLCGFLSHLNYSSQRILSFRRRGGRTDRSNRIWRDRHCFGEGADVEPLLRVPGEALSLWEMKGPGISRSPLFKVSGALSFYLTRWTVIW